MLSKDLGLVISCQEKLANFFSRLELFEDISPENLWIADNVIEPKINNHDKQNKFIIPHTELYQSLLLLVQVIALPWWGLFWTLKGLTGV